MALTAFTSFDDIRAALGVSTDEIDDTTLSLPLYEYSLIGELEDVSLSLASDFAALPPVLTDVQTRFKQSLVLFATYAVAKQLTVSLPLFSPKEIGDGKAHVTRYAQDPYKATIEAVLGEYERTKVRLSSAYLALTSATAAPREFRSYFSSVPAATDPVTGV